MQDQDHLLLLVRALSWLPAEPVPRSLGGICDDSSKRQVETTREIWQRAHIYCRSCVWAGLRGKLWNCVCSRAEFKDNSWKIKWEMSDCHGLAESPMFDQGIDFLN